MPNLNLASICGIYCGQCEYFKKKMCQGCGVQKGKLFWGECPMYICCKNEKELDHCGLCSDFPYQTYLETKDPNDPQADLHKQQNIESLKRRLEIGTEKWLEEQEN
ncbi:MAG: DUF3795 domain-containing protein [Candidatus Aminicenantia bacterium]